MLIDIEKYVRQLLPPNRRLPKHIGLCTALFQPIEAVINEYNDFAYNSQFDTGTPGQVAVLEFILQSYVHPAVRILSGDGLRIDFRVYVPESLSTGERGEVVRIVERYRLRSKRYEIKDQIDWGNEGTNPVIALDFVVSPAIGDTYLLTYSITRPGSYFTKIYNLDTGEVILNQDIEYSINTAVAWQLPHGGRWRVLVGTLSRTVNKLNVELTRVVPPWITWVGYTFDANSREGSIWLDATVNCKLKIKRKDGVDVTGISHDNFPFDSNTWIPGTNIWADPHSEVFRLNPIGPSGLIAGQEYEISIVRESDPSPVFVFDFTMPTVSQIFPPAEIDLDVAPELAACGYGPTVHAIDSATQSQIIYRFSGSGVKRITQYLKDMSNDEIIRTHEVRVATEELVAIFSPGNQPFWNFSTPVPAGNYRLGIEGASCSSLIDWSDTFTITAPVDPGGGGTLDPQLGDYEEFFRAIPWPGVMKITSVPITGGRRYTDQVTLTPPSGYEVSYVINERWDAPLRGVGRLVDFDHQFPGPLSIRKFMNRIGISALWVTGNGGDGMDVTNLAWMPEGVRYAQLDIIYIKQ